MDREQVHWNFSSSDRLLVCAWFCLHGAYDSRRDSCSGVCWFTRCWQQRFINRANIWLRLSFTGQRTFAYQCAAIFFSIIVHTGAADWTWALDPKIARKPYRRRSFSGMVQYCERWIWPNYKFYYWKPYHSEVSLHKLLFERWACIYVTLESIWRILTERLLCFVRQPGCMDQMPIVSEQGRHFALGAWKRKDIGCQKEPCTATKSWRQYGLRGLFHQSKLDVGIGTQQSWMRQLP